MTRQRAEPQAMAAAGGGHRIHWKSPPVVGRISSSAFGRECSVDFARVSGIERDGFQAQFLCSGLCVHAFDIDIGIGGIHQQGNAGHVWGNLPEELDALGAEYILVEEDAGHVPAGAV